MAERRMFAKTIIDSDAFLDMPASSQLLYFHLCMRADDEGFINKPKSIIRLIGCSNDDLKILFAKNFVIPFESGVVVIKHWKIHNYIRSDRFKATEYFEEKAQLTVKKSGAYTLNISDGIPCDNQVTDKCLPSAGEMDTQVRLGKDRLGKDSTLCGQDKPATARRFQKPTLEEVTAYCSGRHNGIDPQRFIDYYEANGWSVGKTHMKDWQAAVRNWERRDGKSAAPERRKTAEDIYG